MRFDDIVNDNKHNFDLIIKNCQPYLRQIKNDLMFRGLTIPQDSNAAFGKKKARLDGREPMDTSPKIHNSLNKHFTEEYGHPYRNGVFTTGDSNIAGKYGDTMMIFPIGDFEFIWHPEIKDLFQNVYAGDLWFDYYKKTFKLKSLTQADYKKYYTWRNSIEDSELLNMFQLKKMKKH